MSGILDFDIDTVVGEVRLPTVARAGGVEEKEEMHETLPVHC